MKKLFVLGFILFLFPFVSSVEFQLKQEFKQGETLITKISGNFATPILKENVVFYRGHVKTPIDYEISKINEEYYIYASLIGKPKGNYSLSIENIEYIHGNSVVDDNLVKNFSINNQTADFSVKPGFISTNKDFFIEVQNLVDSKIRIDIKLQNESTYEGVFDSLFTDAGDLGAFLEINSNNVEKINFEVKNMDNSVLRILELSTPNLNYNIPVFIFKNESLAEEPKRFGFETSSLLVEMPLNDNSKKIIYLLNKGEEPLENISLSVSDSLKPYLDLSIVNVNKLDVGEKQKIELLFSSGNKPNLISGSIRAKDSTDIIDHLTISLNFIEGYIPSIENNKGTDNASLKFTCVELNGVFCSDGEKCSNATERAKDGNCCLAECELTETSSTGKIVGWSIIILIGIFLFWFFKSKYKGAKKKVNLFEVAKGKKSF